VVLYLADLDSGLLLHFAADSFFDRLALVDEPRQRRTCPGSRQPPTALAQQAPSAVRHDHDGDGISTGKMLRFAARALTHVPATTLYRPLAAHATKLVASVPVDLRSALRQDAGFGWAQLCGCGPRLFEPPGLIQPQLVLRVAELRDIDGEVRHAVDLTEKHRGDVDP
jgi:hypothetical protein